MKAPDEKGLRITQQKQDFYFKIYLCQFMYMYIIYIYRKIYVNKYITHSLKTYTQQKRGKMRYENGFRYSSLGACYFQRIEYSIRPTSSYLK